MNKGIRLLILFAISAAIFNFSVYAEKPFVVLSQNENEVVVKYIPQIYDMRIVIIDGAEYQISIGEFSGLTNEVGKPALPVEAFLLALPPNTSLKMEILESKFEVFENQNISPVPMEIYDDEGNATEVYKKNENFYLTETSFYPKDIISIDPPFLFRDVFVSKVALHPLQYSAATKTLKKISHFVFKLRFISERKHDENWIHIPSLDRQFEHINKSLILNYELSKQWRIINNNIKKETIWWNPSQTYYRILIAKDGMYRLTYSQLLNSGIDLQTIPDSTIAIYYKGESVPIYIRTVGDPQNWYIDFYATRKYGDSTFFDIYSDTSHYWLTWNDSNPKRIIDQQQITELPVFSFSSYTAFRHFEKDSSYYYGFNDDEIRTITNVPGEGWYWLDFTATTNKSITFVIDTLNPGRNDVAYFKARFHGMAAYTPPDTNQSRHRVQVRMNGILLGDSLWIQNQELIFRANFPDSILKQGNNTLQINSIFVKLSKFYIDWFQLTYTCPISVEDNYLDFNSPIPPSSEVSEFRIAKVTSDSIDVFDLKTYKKITSLYKYGNIWTFRDTLTTSKRYLITGENQRSIPSAIIPHTFKNIRSNLTGADYIVITHSLFKTSAVQLANWRTTTNILRTVVVDVQDIYDEFNFGHLEPLSIKQFLNYAYNNWPHPKPSFVTMFGDACVDFKRISNTTTKVNYVPGFGRPMSDNALVCFIDTLSFFPLMIIGRIPVENTLQASRVVNKIVNFDNPPRDYWNKRMLFITGGNDAVERSRFNARSDLLINESVTPFPLGGEVFKVYKTSAAIIDDGYKSYMQGLVNEGLSFINFIGHSGGRLWNVDIGNPNDLQNTNGKLPFVSSVSCNIGAFYTTFANVLSEDFLVADNRGGIGAWASSHISSDGTGYWLVKKFLYAAVRESIKTFGELTHLSRIYFWMINGYVITPTIIHTFNLYPLIGEPYSKFPLPEKPNFVLKNEFVTTQPALPTSDNFISIKFNVKNYGLMPSDSILISVRDNYTDEVGRFKGEYDIIPPFLWRPIAYSDTIIIGWDVRGKPGSHILKIFIDPLNSIDEEDETNNNVEIPVYVYRNKIFVLNPKPFSVIPSGFVNLRVTIPMIFDSVYTPYSGGGDTILLPKTLSNLSNSNTFYFELDTLLSFDSPFKIISPPIIPGQVYAEWVTPSLIDNKVFFWRARTYDGKYYGAWVTSSFTVSDSAYNPDIVKWRQTHPQQFSMNEVKNLFISDSGVTMQRSNGLEIYSRSLGYRAYPDSDYYSIIKIGEVTIYGHWWQGANSYLVASIDPLTGSYQARGYSLGTIGQPDSMFRFIKTAPVGNYISIVVVQNGKTNITESLYVAIESLGATQIREVTPGQSWSLISRKGVSGPMMTPLEDYSPNGVAIVTYQMPNYYSLGGGNLTTSSIGPAATWQKLFWNNSNPVNTFINLKLLGIKKDFTLDTIMTIASSDNIVDLSSINSVTYPTIQLIANLSNQYGEITPKLFDWTVTYTPSPDLALSPYAFSIEQTKIVKKESLSVSFEVYNIGNTEAEKFKVAFYLLPETELDSVLVESLPSESEITISRKIDVSRYSGAQYLKVKIYPINWEDQIAENNEIIIPFTIEYREAEYGEITVTFDDRQIQKGDFVSSNPLIKIYLPEGFPLQDIKSIKLDDEDLSQLVLMNISSGIDPQSQNTSNILEFNPILNDGEHKLAVINKNNLVISNHEFKVLNATNIFNAFNYPNPFSDQTMFCFELTGTKVPEKGTIIIYSVTGRKLKEIIIPSYDIQIGFNRIEWDGRDGDGNLLANGVYLYKIQMESDKQVQSPVQKFVKLR